jgi:protein-tyrosine-phosphatase/peptidoglycan/xylan/chitin deacetylase (PgdA/CDA1 family)
LFVCYGNIYRSPTAALVFAHESNKRRMPWGSITSAGFIAVEGRQSPDDAIGVAHERGIPLHEHRSRFLSDELISASDLIVVMDRRNEALLAVRDPRALSRTVLLGAFDPSHDVREPIIADPYGKGDAATKACFERIEHSAKGLLDALASYLPSQPAREGRIKEYAHRALTSPLAMPLWSSARREAASILMLHRFADPDRGISGHDPAVLAANLAFLRRHRFHICSLHDVVKRLLAGEPLVPNTIVFTVDDGYSDFADIAVPVFAQFDVPATLFTVTSFSDGASWIWYDVLRFCAAQYPSLRIDLPVGNDVMLLQWRNAAERRTQIRKLIARLHITPSETTEELVAIFPKLLGVSLPEQPPPRYAPVTWEQMRNLESRGMRFGPHTHTHPILSQASAERARSEVQTSWRRLETELSRPTPVFCFPSGTQQDFTERDRGAVRDAGLAGAVSSFGGRLASKEFMQRRFALPRVAYDEVVSRFRWQVSGPEFIEKVMTQV